MRPSAAAVIDDMATKRERNNRAWGLTKEITEHEGWPKKLVCSFNIDEQRAWGRVGDV